MTRLPKTRDKLPRAHRLVLVAAAISGVVGVVTAVLVYGTGAGFAAIVISGGTATGTTMALAMQVLDYLRRP